MNRRTFLHQLLRSVATLGFLLGTCNAQQPGVDPEDREQFKVAVKINKKDSKKYAPSVIKLRQALRAVTEYRVAFSVDTENGSVDTEAMVEITAGEHFAYDKLIQIVDLAREAGFKSIRIQAFQNLQWEVFDETRFNSVPADRPTVLTVMADLCPGCRRARDRFWSNRTLLEKLAERKAALFFGVGTEDERLREFVKSQYGKNLPVLVILASRDDDQPKILQNIFSEKDVLKALEEKLPAQDFKDAKS